MAARLGGYEGDRAVLYAAVVEFIHTATLVHDDIIDDSELRRGRLAVHSRWGNDITVLLGDYLYIKSMALALTHDTLDLVRVLCDVTLRMIEGELYQLTKNGDADITEDEHFDIIRRKTAYLFGGCAQIGGMLGKVTPRAGSRRCSEYGFNLGIAFQLVDDLLDFTGDAAALGKPIGADLREGKMTLPLIHLLAAGRRSAARRIVREIIASRTTTEEQWDELLRHPQGAPLDRLRVPPRRRVRRARQEAALRVSAERRARRAAGAARLRPLARPVTTRTRMSTTPGPDDASASCATRSATTKSATTSTTTRRSPTRSSIGCCTSSSGSRPSIPISSRPIRRRSASPAGRSRASRRSSTWRRCSASTTPTTTTSCGRSTSACARAPASATTPVAYVAELKIDGLSIALTYEDGVLRARRDARRRRARRGRDGQRPDDPRDSAARCAAARRAASKCAARSTCRARRSSA